MFTTNGNHDQNIILSLVQPDNLYLAKSIAILTGLTILLSLQINRQNRSSFQRLLLTIFFSFVIGSCTYWYLDYINMLKITKAYHQDFNSILDKNKFGKMTCSLPSWNLRKDHSQQYLKSQFCWGPCCILPLE